MIKRPGGMQMWKLPAPAPDPWSIRSWLQVCNMLASTLDSDLNRTWDQLYLNQLWRCWSVRFVTTNDTASTAGQFILSTRARAQAREPGGGWARSSSKPTRAPLPLKAVFFGTIRGLTIEFKNVIMGFYEN